MNFYWNFHSRFKFQQEIVLTRNTDQAVRTFWGRLALTPRISFYPLEHPAQRWAHRPAVHKLCWIVEFEWNFRKKKKRDWLWVINAFLVKSAYPGLWFLWFGLIWFNFLAGHLEKKPRSFICSDVIRRSVTVVRYEAVRFPTLEFHGVSPADLVHD